jgi:hypothetical protein
VAVVSAEELSGGFEGQGEGEGGEGVKMVSEVVKRERKMNELWF